ncbi:serpin family protein [Polystyrenella longa]|nr:serpin family protein [Polystyrenella longa]
MTIFADPVEAKQPRLVPKLINSNSEPRGNKIFISEETQQVVRSSNQFAFDLYQQVRQQKGNLFFSPASISTALAMTYGGAEGLTEREMASVLHLSKHQNAHEGFSTLLSLLNSKGSHNGYSLCTANRLWGHKEFQLESDFLQLTRIKYRAELETLDFSEPEQARKAINEWVKQETQHKIVDLIGSGVLDPDTKIVLTNAIHFEGKWSSAFRKESTRKSPFHLTPANKVYVPTMQQQEKFWYTRNEDAEILSIPYQDQELSIVVILPINTDGLSTLEDKLTLGRFNEWMRQLQRDRPVNTRIPKFMMRSQFRLSDALKSLGMKSAFSNGADFSAMSQRQELKISNVIHQAFIEVDEKGTEAAAATAVINSYAPSGPGKQGKPVLTFHADHPFLFLIRDHRTGAVLFFGRVEQPEY